MRGKFLKLLDCEIRAKKLNKLLKFALEINLFSNIFVIFVFRTERLNNEFITFYIYKIGMIGRISVNGKPQGNVFFSVICGWASY